MATTNATHTTNSYPILEEVDEDEEDQWIDELDEEDEIETYYLEEWPPVIDELYYNPWSDVEATPAFHLTQLLEENIYSVENPNLNVNFELNQDQHDQANQLLIDNINIFSENILEDGQSKELGQTDVICHEINTNSYKPIKQRAYQYPPDEQEFLQKEIQAMEEKGIIRESFGPWSSPVVIEPKKNGRKRLCIDYRKLNAITEKDVYPLPTIQEILNSFNGASWFTSLDLASGYWQVAMKEEDKKKTAFITKFGTYEFNVMPFGLTNAPATFQRLMDKILRPYINKFVVVYLDDITIYSKTFQEHLDHVQQVMNVLKEANLKLNLAKCYFFLNNIKFLGHIIGKDGIKTDEQLVDKIKNFPEPTNLRQLRRFLGIASYY